MTAALREDRELNALAAEKVAGWKFWLETRGQYRYVVWQRPGEPEPWKRSKDGTPDRYEAITAADIDWRRHITEYFLAAAKFCTDMNAALLLADALHAQGWSWSLTRTSDSDLYSAYVWKGQRRDVVNHIVEDTSAARALTVAAILAVGGSPYQAAT